MMKSDFFIFCHEKLYFNLEQFQSENIFSGILEAPGCEWYWWVIFKVKGTPL